MIFMIFETHNLAPNAPLPTGLSCAGIRLLVVVWFASACELTPSYRIIKQLYMRNTDPTIRQPGFDLRRHTWSLIYRFRTGQGPRSANLHKCRLAHSPSCDCGKR